jgi:hypothetical protein
VALTIMDLRRPSFSMTVPLIRQEKIWGRFNESASDVIYGRNLIPGRHE